MAAADDDLTIDVTVEDGDAIVAIGGQLDLLTAPRLGRELMAVQFTQGDNDLILDLEGLSFMDSSGLRVLIDAHLAQQERGQRLVLRNLPPHVARLLEVTNLTGRLVLE